MISQEEITRMQSMVRECESSLTAMFDALRDPCRFRIFLVLHDAEEACVSEIALIIDASLPGASRHLKIMEQAGLVERERKGQTICYRVRTSSSQVAQLVSLVSENAKVACTS